MKTQFKNNTKDYIVKTRNVIAHSIKIPKKKKEAFDGKRKHLRK